MVAGVALEGGAPAVGEVKAKLTPKQKAAAKAKKLKMKAKIAAKAAAKAAKAGAIPADLGAGEGVLAVVTKPKGVGSLRKKIIEGLGDKSIEDAVAEQKGLLKQAEAMIEESSALDDAQAKQATDAQKEFDKAKADVTSLMDAEMAAAAKYRDMKIRRTDALKTVESKRNELLESQKKLAMLEVMAMNHARMAELEAKRKQATEAAEAAKRQLMEQRTKEKAALEATRQALMEARQQKTSALAAVRGAKRPAESEAATAETQANVD